MAAVTALAFGNAAPDALVYDDGYFLPIPRDEMSRTRPGFAGFKFEPDQTYVIVVGRTS